MPYPTPDFNDILCLPTHSSGPDEIPYYSNVNGEGRNWVTVSGYTPIYGNPLYIWYQNVGGYLFYKSVTNIAVYYKYGIFTERWNYRGVCLVLLRSLRHDSSQLGCASASLTRSIHLHIGVTIYQKGPKWTGTDRNGFAKVQTDFL